MTTSLTQVHPEIFVPDLIISGGQSGTDRGSLLGAHSLGIPTGGFAPKGWRTETGPKPDLGSVFGLVESDSEDYAVRTWQNINVGDVVIVVSYKFDSPGTMLTLKLAHSASKPIFEVPFPHFPQLGNPYLIGDLRAWLRRQRPAVAMFAGNRESKAPGIQNWTRNLVLKLFS